MRDILTISTAQLKEIMRLCIEHRKNLLMVGPPGCGKSMMTEQVTTALDVDLIPTSPGIEDPTDSKGMPFTYFDQTLQRQVAHFMPFSQLEQVLTAKKRTVYFMDDLGQAPESVQKAKMALINPGYVNGTKISREVLFFAATNRRRDRSGVKGIYEAVLNRFHIIAYVMPNIDDWVEDFALPAGQPIEHIAFNRFRPEWINMTNWKPSDDIIPTATPRSITAVGDWILTNPPKELEYVIYSGAAGEAYAAEEIAFLKIFTDPKLPKIDRIIMGQVEPVPTDPAMLYAVCAALTSKATDQTFGNIIKYANRMTPEFSVMLVRDIITQTRELVNSKAFIEWSVKHSNVLS